MKHDPASKHDPAVLEHNLRGLFARSWSPLAIDPGFQARLSAELCRRREPIVPARSLRTWRIAAGFLALIGLAALVFAIQHQRSHGLTDPKSLFAAGSNAVRLGTAAEWNAIDAHAAAQGVEYDGLRLELATAPARTQRVWCGSEGALELGLASQAELDGPGSALHSSLSLGSLRAERLSAGEPWILAAAGVHFELARGALALELATPERVRARLTSGAARARGDGIALDLAVGKWVQFVRGVPLAASTSLSTPLSDDARTSLGTSLGTGTSAVLDPATPAPASTSLHIQGRVLEVDGQPFEGAFTLALLRKERLPAVAEPKEQHCSQVHGVFQIAADSAGSFTLFVCAPGRAVAQRSFELPLAAGLSLELRLDPGVAVRGRVVDADSGAPIEGALVLSEDDAPYELLSLAPTQLGQNLPAQAVSGKDGRFELAHLARGRHVLRATHATHGAAWSTRVLIEDQTSELELRLPQSATLAGRVERSDGRAWEGAIVIASLMDMTLQRTRISYARVACDAQGAYQISGLPPGALIVFNASEVENNPSPHVRAVTLKAGETQRLDLRPAARGAALGGKVLDARGLPLGGVDVTVSPAEGREANRWESARTDAQGDYHFDDLAPGRYALFVGGDLGTHFVRVGEATLERGTQGRADVRLGTARISGSVRRKSDGGPVGASWIILAWREGSEWRFAGRSQADGAGRFALEGLRPGAYRVQAFAERDRIAPAMSDELWIVDEHSALTADLICEEGAQVELFCHDPDGHPLARVAIRVHDANGVELDFSAGPATDAEGRFSIAALSTGRWTIEARADGHAAARASLDIVAGLDAKLNLILEPR